MSSSEASFTNSYSYELHFNFCINLEITKRKKYWNKGTRKKRPCLKTCFLFRWKYHVGIPALRRGRFVGGRMVINNPARRAFLLPKWLYYNCFKYRALIRKVGLEIYSPNPTSMPPLCILFHYWPTFSNDTLVWVLLYPFPIINPLHISDFDFCDFLNKRLRCLE